MDTPAQNPIQTNQQQAQDSGQSSAAFSSSARMTGQPVQQPLDNAQGAMAPAPPVSIPISKENEVIAIPKPQEQWIGETAPEAKIAKEVQEAGVDATKGEVLHVSQDVAQAGVVPSGAAAPIPTEPTVQFPMTEEKAKSILKLHKKVRDSVTWLAMLILRQFQMTQFKKKGNWLRRS